MATVKRNPHLMRLLPPYDGTHAEYHLDCGHVVIAKPKATPNVPIRCQECEREDCSGFPGTR